MINVGQLSKLSDHKTSTRNANSNVQKTEYLSRVRSLLWIQNSRVTISVYKGGTRKRVRGNKMMIIQVGKTVCVLIVV